MHNIILNNYDDVLIFWPSILQPGSFDSHKTLINFVMDSGSTFTVLKTAPIIIEAWSYLDDRPVSHHQKSFPLASSQDITIEPAEPARADARECSRPTLI